MAAFSRKGLVRVFYDITYWANYTHKKENYTQHYWRFVTNTALINNKNYYLIQNLNEIDEWINEAEEIGEIAVDTETDSLDPHQANLVGISLVFRVIRAALIFSQYFRVLVLTLNRLFALMRRVIVLSIS